MSPVRLQGMRNARLVLPLAAALGLAGCGAGTALAGVHDAPAQVTNQAPISPESAQQIAERVITKVDEADRAGPEVAKDLRAEAFTGAALAVAKAADQLGEPAAAPNPVSRTEAPKVLAVSRGTGWPRLIVAQTTSGDGGSVLNLLVSADARTPFRLSASATMHPGASVSALDSLTKGSPAVTDGAGLVKAPKDLLAEYAASLAYPRPAKADDVDASDQFTVGVRANAAAQAKSFGKLATLTQKHEVQPDQTLAIQLRGGGALVFALLERTDTITLKKGGKSLTPSSEFQRLVRKKTLEKNAELKSYETVVLTVPDQGKAAVVAADEVLFSAKGA
jgi:hypothetical protein